MPYLARGNAKIYYEIDHVAAKTLPVVTLLNGFMRPLSDFRMFSRKLREAGFEPLLMNPRGSGESEVSQPFTLATMREDVQALWDSLDIHQSSLVGISMGGVVAQHLAIKNQNRVSRLALISTAVNNQWIRSPAITSWDSLEEVLSFLRPYFSGEFLKRNQLLINAMAKQMIRSFMANPDRHSERAHWQRQAICQFDTREFLSKLNMKTLVVHGEADEIIPVSVVKEFQRRIPNCQLSLIAGKGHLLLAESPAWLYSTVIDFLKS